MKSNELHAFIVTLLALALHPGAQAAEAKDALEGSGGVIQGRVIDQVTGEYLENARVTLAGRPYVANTERGGSFVLGRVPAGEHILVVYYTGYDTATKAVQVAAGREIAVEVQLSSTVLMENFVVTDYRRGDADELMLRRRTINVVDVASSKTFGEQVDGGLSDVVRRMPGMTGGAGVRGIAGEYNLVRVDGAAFASPTEGLADGTSREVDIDQVAAGQIERIEVIKAPTPDRDADAVGGTINLITKSPFDRKGRETSYSVGGTYSPSYQIAKLGYIASFNQSDILGKKRRVGYNFSLNVSRVFTNDESLVTDYALYPDVAGVSLEGPAPISAVETQQTLVKDDRIGGGLKLEFKAGDDAVVFVNTLFRNRFRNEDRQGWKIRGRDAILAFDQAGKFWYSPSRVRAGQGNIDGRQPLYDANGRILAGTDGRGQGGTLPSFDTNVTEMLVSRDYAYRDRTRDRYNDSSTAQFGGRYAGLAETKIDFNTSYSWGRAKRLETPARDGGQLSVTTVGTGFRIDRTNNWLYPEITRTGGTDYTNLNTGLVTVDLNMEDQVTTEGNIGFELNAERAIKIMVPAFLKAGVRYRRDEQDIDCSREQYSYALPDISRFVSNTSFNPFGQYPSSALPSASVANSARLQNPVGWVFAKDASITRSAQGDANFSEGITGAYIMSTVRIGSLSVLTGVRTEWTRFKGTGALANNNLTVAAGQWDRKISRTGGYNSVFPHFHVRYEPVDRLVIRGSWSTSIGRPAWRNIIPQGSFDSTAETISITNPKLGPQYANNFDLSAEYYLEPAGLFAINLFRKEIDHFLINTTRRVEPGDNLDPAFDGWKISTQENGGSAWVNGVEFDYRQQLSFLSGWMSGLGIYANLTLLRTAGNYSTPDGSVTSAIPGFVPKMANVGVSYTAKRLSLRVQANYKGENLERWDPRPARNYFRTASKDVDIRTSYRFARKLRVFVNVLNLFEPTELLYQQRSSQPWTVTLVSRRIDFGVQGSF